MKTNIFLLTAIVAVLLTSCKSVSYYQVYKAVPTDKLTNTGNRLVYEDDNCKVSYNFWGQGGNIGFSFYNKTDRNIYLNLDESFFILNGIAHNYYKNRVFTDSKSSGTTSSLAASISKSVTGINFWTSLPTSKRVEATSSVGSVASSGYSVSYNEEKIICIPSKTLKIIAEYNINESLYRDCDLLLYPYATKRQTQAKEFSRTESPFVFSNRIAYAVGQSGYLIRFENEFYISEISNYPEKMLIVSTYDVFCKQKNWFKTEYFKDVSPDKFYIKYTKLKKDDRTH